jgi:nucleotide-binding universal stress UspA family protein
VAVRFGDPGHEIARYAEDVSAGLIVVSPHGKSGLERLLIGSVADRVVRLAHCPVLLMKR